MINQYLWVLAYNNRCFLFHYSMSTWFNKISYDKITENVMRVRSFCWGVYAHENWCLYYVLLSVHERHIQVHYQFMKGKFRWIITTNDLNNWIILSLEKCWENNKNVTFIFHHINPCDTSTIIYCGEKVVVTFYWLFLKRTSKQKHDKFFSCLDTSICNLSDLVGFWVQKSNLSS